MSKKVIIAEKRWKKIQEMKLWMHAMTEQTVLNALIDYMHEQIVKRKTSGGLKNDGK